MKFAAIRPSDKAGHRFCLITSVLIVLSQTFQYCFDNTWCQLQVPQLLVYKETCANQLSYMRVQNYIFCQNKMTKKMCSTRPNSSGASRASNIILKYSSLLKFVSYRACLGHNMLYLQYTVTVPGGEEKIVTHKMPSDIAKC